MANEAQGIIPSAVLIPDVTDVAPSLLSPAKRRYSSVSLSDTKRPRLEPEEARGDQNGRNPARDGGNGRPDRRRSGQAEERNRGKRLFGALLGTLSQSSSSTAQRRRADIEKKQQAKLTLQAETYDEKKRAELDQLKIVRKREQKKFDEQSMRIRHSNTLATAHFLRTTAEPLLYYKPWELRPAEEARIKSQIEDAEASIGKELQEVEANRQPDQDQQHGYSDEHPIATSHDLDTTARDKAPETLNTHSGRSEIKLPRSPNADATLETASTRAPDPAIGAAATEDTLRTQSEAGDGYGDENAGEVVVEGDEDTVIY